LIFVGTKVVSETLRKEPDEAVMAWLVRFEAELALPTVSIAEIAYGIQKIRPDERAERLEQGLTEWRRRFADRMFGLTEEAALAYGDIMGKGGSSRLRDVSSRCNDCRNHAGERRTFGHTQSQRLRNDGSRSYQSMGFLTRSSVRALLAAHANFGSFSIRRVAEKGLKAYGLPGHCAASRRCNSSRPAELIGASIAPLPRAAGCHDWPLP